ncbi:DUF202 domain-containing protein [Streptomyces sp. B6B3]|uniref:DUF202 domain-containing protein n=1 Tax=Streptomyces sp. B6B3 TaxID=3153570 RepID=UPI00325F5D3D
MNVARDPGAQPERTRLAWRRTTLTFTLVVVLAARKLVVSEDGVPSAAVVAVALQALLWVGFLILAHRRIRALADDRRPPAAEESTVRRAAGLIALSALLGALLLVATA